MTNVYFKTMMKKQTILLLMMIAVAGYQCTSSKVKNQEQPSGREWHQLTITSAGDTVIYNRADASHRSLIVDGLMKNRILNVAFPYFSLIILDYKSKK